MIDGDGKEKNDVKLPEGEVGDQISKEFDDGADLMITIISAMGMEQAISFKQAPQ